MAIDEQHVALPKLIGAPAYARPARVAPPSDRPFDPDDLPIEAIQTDEERELAASLPALTDAPGAHATADHKNGHGSHEPSLNPRPLSLRALAGRILGSGDN